MWSPCSAKHIGFCHPYQLQYIPYCLFHFYVTSFIVIHFISTSLEDSDRINLPIRLRIRRWILRNILDTCLHLVLQSVHRTPTLLVRVARKVPTKGGVEDESVLFELLINVAGPLEVGLRCAELGHVGRVGVEGFGDSAAWKEPDLDEAAGPLHGVHAATDAVERVAVRSGVRNCDAAADWRA